MRKRYAVMESKMVNISSTPNFASALTVGFFIFEVTPRLIQADVGDPSYIEASVFFYFILHILKYVNGKLPYFLSWLSEFPGFARRNDNSVYIEAAVFVVISYAELLQVSWSYIWLAVFPAISIGFILSLHNKLNLQSGSQQEGEATSAGDDPGSGEEIKKAEEQGHDEEAEASTSAGDLGSGKEIKKTDDQQEFVTGVPCWMFYILRWFPRADNFAVSMFLLFLSFTLGALTRMMMKLAQAKAAPGGAPASALLRKASLVVLLVAVHAIAVELLGDKVVLFILPELAPLLLWLSVHVDRAKEGAIITAERITISTNPVSAGAVGVVFMACLAVTMGESIFSWFAKAVVSSGVSGLLVFYIVSMISQWRPGQADGKATPCLLEETVELLKVWAKVLLITATVLLVPTSVTAVRLGLHEQMLAAPVEFFNKYVTTTTSSL